MRLNHLIQKLNESGAPNHARTTDPKPSRPGGLRGKLVGAAESTNNPGKPLYDALKAHFKKNKPDVKGVGPIDRAIRSVVSYSGWKGTPPTQEEIEYYAEQVLDEWQWPLDAPELTSSDWTPVVKDLKPGQFSESDTDDEALDLIEKLGDVGHAILRRIEFRHLDLIEAHGLRKVVDAIQNVESHVGEVDEIGGSDVSIWVNWVRRDLERRA